jgi:hypothetical protein
MAIFNSTETDLKFGSVETSCLCSDADIPAGIVKMGESVKCVVSFKTPSSVSSGKFSFFVRVYPSRSDKSESVRIGVFSLVAGTLQFDKARTMFSARHEFNEWKTPFTFSAPVTLERLRLRKSDSFRDFVTEIRETENGGELVISAPLAMVGDSSVSGWFELSDPISDVTNRIELLIARRQPVSIVPALVRLRGRKEGDPGMLFANAMLQIHRAEKTQEKSVSPIRVRCMAGDIEFNVKVQELSAGLVYRLVVVVAKEKLIDEFGDKTKLPLTWLVVVDGENHKFSKTLSWKD